ncbi:MAG: nitroreductase family protein [Bacilli bacterium]|nr:nitroreductase family protein [Bacilli bacterium]
MLKKVIKKVPGFKALNNTRKSIEFYRDKKFFLKNYMHSKGVTKDKIEYELLLEIHKLEKGFAVVNPRVFGIEKVKRIIELLNLYEKLEFEPSFSSNLGFSSLFEYKNFFEQHNWTETEAYKIIDRFLIDKKVPTELAGAFDLQLEDIIEASSVDYESFLKSRKSVRNFSNKEITESIIKKATEIAILSPSACNRQMCKVYFINDEKNKRVIENYAQGLGLFDLTNANYVVITFDVAANYFIGERNQGWFNAGLFSMNFVNALHSLGIGSCFIQFGNSFKEEEEFKNKLDIPHSERVAVIITLGYYDKVSRIPYSTRKPIKEIYRKR